MRFIPTIFLLFFAAAAPATEYSVVVGGIARPVTLSVPDSFKLANSSEARGRRERLLAFFSSNSALKGSYDEVLLQDWQSAGRVPVIVVGTLGAVKNHQGQVSAHDWEDIRRQFEQVAPSKVAEIRNAYRIRIEANSPVLRSTVDDLVWFEHQRDPLSVVVLARIEVEEEGKRWTEFTARKIMYHRGFIVFANVAVDAAQAGALSTLKQYLVELSIVDI